MIIASRLPRRSSASPDAPRSQRRILAPRCALSRTIERALDESAACCPTGSERRVAEETRDSTRGLAFYVKQREIIMETSGNVTGIGETGGGASGTVAKTVDQATTG